MLDDKSEKLLALLRANARESTASLGRELHLSRSAVSERIAKLESSGQILGYTIREPESVTAQFRAFCNIAVEIGGAEKLGDELVQMQGVKCIHACTGDHAWIVELYANSTEVLNALVDRVGKLDNVVSTDTVIVLATKAAHSV